MKLLSLSALALLLLTGCGATYTKLEHPKTAGLANAGEADCPNGINYKTGHCR
jgi:hypothetical protein